MIQYTKGYKYQLHTDYEIDLPPEFGGYTATTRFYEITGRRLCIRAGYAWNGASGPTWDDKSNMRGSLVHDCLYQAMVEDRLPRTLRGEADKLLHTLCIEDGMNRVRAAVWLWAVRRHGLVPSIRNKDILVAP